MKHVFISYMKEDSQSVKSIASDLRRNGIYVWLDRDELRPGQRWAVAIRKAIQDGAFYIACFSRAYTNRSKSYMNEELTLAIEELRQRPTDTSWFIPVLLDNCEVPDRNIGAGETLRSIQWVKLYEDYTEGIQRILSVIRPDFGGSG